MASPDGNSKRGTPSTPPRANGPAHGATSRKLDPSPSRGAAVASEHVGLVGVGDYGQGCNVTPVTSETLAAKSPHIQEDAMVFWEDADCTSQQEIRKKVKEIAEVHDILKDQAPGVPEATTGNRVLYIPVFSKLHPITELHGKDLFNVWYQCILYHITLSKKEVHHCDVSPPNLMWYKKDGKLIGILNDYDLSSLANEPGPRGNEGTGTVPFMARDLLTEEGQRGEVTHLYRHDLESFIWCFAWISLRYKEGVLRPRGSRPFDEWATLDAVACGKEKLTLQTDRNVPAGTHQDDPMWKFFCQFLKVLDRQAYARRIVQEESGAGENFQESESERDMDIFLAKFTGTKAWADLSNLSK